VPVSIETEVNRVMARKYLKLCAHSKANVSLLLQEMKKYFSYAILMNLHAIVRLRVIVWSPLPTSSIKLCYVVAVITNQEVHLYPAACHFECLHLGQLDFPNV